MENKLLVLGGGTDQIDLINALKERGYFVAIADYNQEPMALDCCDEHFPISTLDTERVIELGHEIGVSRILTAFTDQALMVAAEASEALSLPFHLSTRQTRALTNKRAMKAVLKQHSIPSARYETLLESETPDHNLNYPVVVKPVDSNSSKGITRVTSPSGILEAYQLGFDHSRSGEIIVEEFKEGSELSIDAFVDQEGIAHLLLITKSVKNAGQGSFFPISASVFNRAEMERYSPVVKELIQRISSAYELRNTGLLVQAIVLENDIHVIELSARTGGGLKHRLIQRATGLDVVDLTIDSLLDNPIGIPRFEVTDDFLIMKYLYVLPGIFGGSLRNGEQAEELEVLKRPNTEVTDSINSSGRVGAALISGKSPRKAKEKLSRLYQSLEVLDTDGGQMLDHSDLNCFQGAFEKYDIYQDLMTL